MISTALCHLGSQNCLAFVSLLDRREGTGPAGPGVPYFEKSASALQTVVSPTSVIAPSVCAQLPVCGREKLTGRLLVVFIACAAFVVAPLCAWAALRAWIWRTCARGLSLTSLPAPPCSFYRLLRPDLDW